MRAIELLSLTTQASLPLARLEDGCHFRLSLSRARATANLRRTSLFRSRFCPKMAFVCLDCRTCHCHVRCMYALSGWTVGVGGRVEFRHSGIDRDGSPAAARAGDRRRTLGCRRTQLRVCETKRSRIGDPEDNENEGKIIPFAFTGT